MAARPCFLIPVLAATALITSACNGFGPFNAKDGSGVLETTTIETGDFDKIAVTGVFDVMIVIDDGPPSVEVTIDDNLVNDLDVRVDNDRLRIGFRCGSYNPSITPTAVVTMADLEDLDVSGASRATADGIDSDLLTLDASGASSISMSGTARELTLDASGASSISVSGTATELSLDASGASSMDLGDLATSRAEVELSGASIVDLGSVDRISGDLSGASVLRAPASASMIGSVDISGASQIERN